MAVWFALAFGLVIGTTLGFITCSVLVANRLAPKLVKINKD